MGESDHRELVNLNGTYQNKSLRSMSDLRLGVLIGYASQQKPLPFSGRNEIAAKAEREQDRRGVIHDAVFHEAIESATGASCQHSDCLKHEVAE